MKNAEVRCGGCFSRRWRARNDDAMTKRQTFIAMKLLLLLTAAAWLQTSARGYGQTISLTLKNTPLDKVFAAIEKQSPYHFIYAKEELAGCKAVTVSISSASIQAVLDLCLKEQPLVYALNETYIIIKRKNVEKERTAPVNKILKGKVVNEKGEGIAGATVSLARSNIATATDDKGEFTLTYTGNYSHVLISSVGYEQEEIALNNREYVEVVMRIAVNSLDETVVMAYGRTSRRFNTGNIFKVRGEDLSNQPVSNVLAALEGRVPGMIVTQTSGVPGSAFTIEIRGRSSLDLNLSRNDPLFIIDGVPFEQGNVASNQIVSAANKPGATSQGGISPLNTLNIQDIESIEVLKDADATAIYGSRGANGVILITTKKGKPGRTKLSARSGYGWSRATRTMDMLNTAEYLSMRREAFVNDGLTPNNTNAPDIMLWDTTRYTDFKQLLIGRSASTQDAQITFSGGNELTQFSISGGYHRETNVFSSGLADRKANLHFTISNRSVNQRFNLQFSGFYGNDNNQLIQTDLTQYINLPPNLLLYDSAGNLNWKEGGVNYNSISNVTNPLSFLLRKYNSINENTGGNLQLSYKLLRGLTLTASTGINKFSTDETAINPKASIAPTLSTLASSSFANGNFNSWIAEPQIKYSHQIGKHELTVLIGGTWQERISKSRRINASNYTSDILLNSAAAAGATTATSDYSQYRYTAYFGRITYTLQQRYLVNLTVRRDGSTRFGPGSRYANFGAVGAGWIFSNEAFIQKALPFLSFGKLRVSYGITGNDQIGDYKYLDLWNPAGSYQGVPALINSSLFNVHYEWEINRKAEAAAEAGFFKDRVLFSASFYFNRCSNQLVSYILPNQTGFSSINKNLPALVQNRGTELTLTTKNITTDQFNWSSSFHITMPRNKLISFPGLDNSSYSSIYKEGSSVYVFRGLKYLGVNDTSGIYEFEDVNKDGVINTSGDFQFLHSLEPKLYGGLQNQFRIKNLSIDIFFEFRQQKGKNYLASLAAKQPGFIFNQPTTVQSRWQRSGDNRAVQKYTSSQGSVAAIRGGYFALSDGAYTNASFTRLRNLSVQYKIPERLTKKLHVENFSVYLRAQNLLTLTRYRGSDPETQDINVLPPLRTISTGIQFNF
ncbi:MAG: SusC/RagA family TonB-linked outer membrane protein [Chitinophagaceae bacterium]|nr:SusC/RagA family TonB-linked outer membrane protein [Chitinophagaceae bacterium]